MKRLAALLFTGVLLGGCASTGLDRPSKVDVNLKIEEPINPLTDEDGNMIEGESLASVIEKNGGEMPKYTMQFDLKGRVPPGKELEAMLKFMTQRSEHERTTLDGTDASSSQGQADAAVAATQIRADATIAALGVVAPLVESLASKFLTYGVELGKLKAESEANGGDGTVNINDVLGAFLGAPAR